MSDKLQEIEARVASVLKTFGTKNDWDYCHFYLNCLLDDDIPWLIAQLREAQASRERLRVSLIISGGHTDLRTSGRMLAADLEPYDE